MNGGLEMIEAIAVMMNNYFHDLAVAFLFASCVLARVALDHWPGPPSPRGIEILRRVAWGSLAWVMVGGAVRAWFYMDYEWLPKAGTAQLPALAIKHIVLVSLTIWGLVGVVRLQRLLTKKELHNEHGE
jgi:hypothetical protein